MSIPSPLKSDDKVAIVATAKRLETSIEKGIETLESWGLKIELGRFVHEVDGYFAGNDEQKLADVQSALDSSEIKAIIFLRGGYGTTRILDRLDFNEFTKNPKWLVGFSDLTAMLLQLDALNIPSIHGPMTASIGNDSESDEVLRRVLFGETHMELPCEAKSDSVLGTCSGKIVGGNLSLIYESIGSQNEIDTKGNILFLEEVGEDIYSLDRMLTKLKRTNKLSSLSGAIIGSFSHITNSNDYFTISVEELIMQYLGPLGIPVSFGLSAGHEKKNLSLVFGRNTNLVIDKDVIKLEYL